MRPVDFQARVVALVSQRAARLTAPVVARLPVVFLIVVTMAVVALTIKTELETPAYSLPAANLSAVELNLRESSDRPAIGLLEALDIARQGHFADMPVRGVSFGDAVLPADVRGSSGAVWVITLESDEQSEKGKRVTRVIDAESGRPLYSATTELLSGP